MQRYKLTFDYDGTAFSGWQIQPDVRTVEGVIEQAFSTLYQLPVNIIGQGRTDAGVHALAQTAHVDLPDSYSPRRVIHAMKGLLPEDVSLVKMEIASPNFHARFDATSRSYRYQIVNRPSPLHRHFSWYCYSDLNEELLHQSAELFLGEHDFLNFCIPHDQEEMTTICTLTNSQWRREGEMLIYEIQGNRFLRHLVRRLVGTMTEVASNRMNFSDLEDLLKAETTNRKGHTAPAHGLTLESVTYSN